MYNKKIHMSFIYIFTMLTVISFSEQSAATAKEKESLETSAIVWLKRILRAAPHSFLYSISKEEQEDVVEKGRPLILTNPHMSVVAAIEILESIYKVPAADRGAIVDAVKEFIESNMKADDKPEIISNLIKTLNFFDPVYRSSILDLSSKFLGFFKDNMLRTSIIRDIKECRDYDALNRAFNILNTDRDTVDTISNIIIHIKHIRQEDREDVISRSVGLVADLDPQRRFLATIISTVGDMPRAQRDDLIRLSSQFFMPGMDGYDRDHILTSVRFLPANMRNILERLHAQIIQGGEEIPNDPKSRAEWIRDSIYDHIRRMENIVRRGGNGVPGPIRSTEIHAYSRTLVPVPASEKSCKTDAKDKKLNDAIEDLLKSKLHENAIVVEIDLEEVKILLNQSIDRAFTSPLPPQETRAAKKLREQRDSEKKAGARRALEQLLQMHQAGQYLPLVITFLRKIHPGNQSLDLWTSQSLGESTEAYGHNTLSCQQGIRERVFTGLRGADTDIDKLVGPVEAHFLALSSITASSNVHDPKTANKIAQRIIEEGYSENTKKSEALQMYKQYLQKQILSLGGDVRKYEGEVTATLEAVEDNFDGILKPILDELLTQQGSRSSSPRASAARYRSSSPQARASIGRSRSPSPVPLGGVTHEQLGETRKIMQAQDTAYNESLRKDEEKRRKKQLEEEQRQREMDERAASTRAAEASRPMPREELRQQRLKYFSTDLDKATKKPS